MNLFIEDLTSYVTAESDRSLGVRDGNR